MEQVQTQADVKLKSCSICGKDIEEPKYRIHEATCARNNYRCPQCGEVVPKGDKDHHDQENHVQIPCQYCKNFAADKKGLQVHEQQCDMQPRQCLFCEIKVAGDKYNEHLTYCGSKTKKCDLCKQMVQNRDLAEHESQGQCGFYQDIERDKNQRELMKFQEEEQKRVASNLIQKQKEEQKRKEMEYINSQAQRNMPQQFRQQQQNIGSMIPQQNVSSGLGVSRSHPVDQRSAFEDDIGVEGNLNQTTTDEETQRLIAKMLQEEMDEQDARNIGRNDNIPSSGFEDPFGAGGGHSPTNVRPAQDIYEDQMIGGPQNYSYSSSMNRPGMGGPGFVQHSQSYFSSNMPGGPSSTSNVRGGFNPIQQPSSHHFQYNEDSSMANDFDNEEDQLNRVIAESMAMQGVGGSQQPVVDVNDTEEELLRQIMEQSKREAGQ
eukprot:403334376